jgi:hypothetical protein
MNRKLKAKIIEHYGSQANFSQIIGKPEPFISRVVNSRIELDAVEKRRWAELLRVSIETLFDVKG